VKLLNDAQEQHLKEISTHLRQMRQDKSLSLEEIALQTRIREAFLKALEEERFEDLPEPVFVQGFIRRYGDALGLDGVALASKFGAYFSSSGLSWESNEWDKKLNIHIPLYVPYILLLLAASFGLFYILVPKHTGEYLTESQESPVASKPQVTASSTPTPATLVNSSLEVTLQAKSESWLRVKSDDKTVFEGNLPKGEPKTWTAKKQISVRSGNAGAVLISTNKQPAKLMGTEDEVKEVTLTNEQAPQVKPSATP
jgi:cytoskeletal protein RodZ